MYNIKVHVRGLSPLSFNQPPKALTPAGGRPTEEERAQEVEERIYTNGNGVFIPRRWLKKVLLEGCTLANLKAKGNRSLYPYLDGGVLVVEDEIPLGQETYDFIHERWGRIPPQDWRVSYD